MEKIFEKFTLTSIKAVAYGDNTVQDAILIHDNDDEFCDGDCILFGYNMSDFDLDDDVETVLQNEYCATYSRVEDGTYYSN